MGQNFFTQATWWKFFCNWRSTTEKHYAQKQLETLGITQSALELQLRPLPQVHVVTSV